MSKSAVIAVIILGVQLLKMQRHHRETSLHGAALSLVTNGMNTQALIMVTLRDVLHRPLWDKSSNQRKEPQPDNT